MNGIIDVTRGKFIVLDDTYKSMSKDTYKDRYTTGKETAEYLKDGNKSLFKNTIASCVTDNLTGEIFNNQKKRDSDKKCFEALGYIAGLGKRFFPDSEIYKVADETFNKLHDIMEQHSKILNKEGRYFQVNMKEGKKMTPNPHLRHVETQFECTANEAGGRIIELLIEM